MLSLCWLSAPRELWGDDDTSYSYVHAVYESGFPLNDDTLSLIVDNVIKDVKCDYDDDDEEDGEKHDLHVSEVRFVDCQLPRV